VVERLRHLPEDVWILVALALLVLSFLAGAGEGGLGAGIGWAALVAVLFLALARPRACAMALVMLFPTRPLLGDDPGSNPLHLLGIAVAVGTAALWLRDRRRLRTGAAHGALLVMVALGALSLTVQVGPSSTWNLLTWVKALALSVVLAELVDSRRTLWRMTAAFALSAALTAGLLLVDFLPYALGVQDSPDPMRYRWAGSPDSSTLATFLGAGCVAVLPLLDPPRRGWRRFAPWVLAALAFAGVIALGSRLVWLAVLVAAVVYLLAGRGVGVRWERAVAFAVLPLAIGALGIAVGLSDPTLGKRLSRSTESVHKASGGRVDIWRVGWRITEAHPFRGVGIGNFPAHFDRAKDVVHPPVRSRPGRSPHNTFLGLWAELGFVAPLALAAAFAFAVRQLLRARKKRETPIAGYLALLAYTLAVMLAQDQLGTLHPWVILGLVAAAGRVDRPPDPYASLQGDERD